MLSLRVVLFLILFLLPFKTASQIGVALGVDRTFQSHLNDFVKKSEGRIGHRSLKYLTLQLTLDIPEKYSFNLFIFTVTFTFSSFVNGPFTNTILFVILFWA